MVSVCINLCNFCKLEEKMKKFNILVVVIALFLMSGHAIAKKKLYKWVDEDGNVTYSDQVPPDQITKEHEELNKDGVVLDKIENVLTAEEKVAEREKKRLAREAKELAIKQEQIRKNIIKAYTNEQEIIRLKDERLSALERNIELANQSLEFQKISQEQILARAADSERNGQQVSDALKSRIRTIEEKIKYQKEFIESKTQEIEKVKTKFESDLKTYRQATKGLQND